MPFAASFLELPIAAVLPCPIMSFEITKPVLVLACALVAATTSACGLVAGLGDHELLEPDGIPKGFPDSPTALCADGTGIVACGSVPPAYEGQDGRFQATAPKFTVTNENVAFDTTTNLSWWRQTIPSNSWETASATCASFPGGYRLPTRLELVTILDFGRTSGPLVDPTVFPGAKEEAYWTASRYVHITPDAMDYWTVNLCTDCEPEIQFQIVHANLSGPSRSALCVRGEPYLTGPFEEVRVDGQGVGLLRDLKTGLVWFSDAKDTSGFSWQEALAFCEESQWSGQTDWRLPTIKELQTVVDETRTGETSFFDGFVVASNTPNLWSSTPTPLGTKAFQVTAQGGSTWRTSSAESYFYALCVRGPE